MEEAQAEQTADAEAPKDHPRGPRLAPLLNTGAGLATTVMFVAVSGPKLPPLNGE